MTHRRAVALMILTTLLWSMAGVVTRQLDAARSFEVNFWRSLFNALALAPALYLMRGPGLWRGIARARWPLWASAACWSVMFTGFMVAITLTTVATVLVVMAICPLVTALFARLFLKQTLPARTWLAIIVGGAGVAWMFGGESMQAGVDGASDGASSPVGALVALGVPLAAAINWTVLQFAAHGEAGGPRPERTDMLPAVLIGAVLSALATLPLALPLRASAHDLGLLALLGVAQLAIPCLLAVRLTRELPAAEIALLGLLELLFGVTWAWLGAGETPSAATLTGGALVIGALIANELLALRRSLALQN
jgi:drug/metabolite transporter (DMT)-like permease